jgi:DNA mismatch repair protein MSH4
MADFLRIVDGAPDDLDHYGLSQFSSSEVGTSTLSIPEQGLELARLADLPPDVLAEAKKAATNLIELDTRQHEESRTGEISERRKALLRVLRISCSA